MHFCPFILAKSADPDEKLPYGGISSGSSLFASVPVYQYDIHNEKH